MLAQRSGFQAFGCVSTPRAPFHQSVPKLSGAKDPLVDVADAIANANGERSRERRTEIIVEQFIKTEGPSVIPLLGMLEKRSIFAARSDDVLNRLEQLSENESPVIRRAAIRCLSKILSSLDDNSRRQKSACAEILRTYLMRPHEPTIDRVLAITALGDLGSTGIDLEWPGRFLRGLLQSVKTEREYSATVTALGNLGDPKTSEEVIEALKKDAF